VASRHCSQSLPPCAYSPPLRQANKEHDGRPQDHDEPQSARRGRSSPRVRLGGNAVAVLRASPMHMFPRATRRRPCRLAVPARRSFRNPLNTDVMKAGSYICSVRAKPAADGLPQAAIPAASATILKLRVVHLPSLPRRLHHTTNAAAPQRSPTRTACLAPFP